MHIKKEALKKYFWLYRSNPKYIFVENISSSGINSYVHSEYYLEINIVKEWTPWNILYFQFDGRAKFLTENLVIRQTFILDLQSCNLGRADLCAEIQIELGSHRRRRKNLTFPLFQTCRQNFSFLRFNHNDFDCTFDYLVTQKDTRIWGLNNPLSGMVRRCWSLKVILEHW